jgi:hypothetical protein
MAGQPSFVFVLHQPGRTVRAGEFVAAGFAQGKRSIAAAVEEQHRLFACRQRAFQCDAQRRRQPLRLLLRIDSVSFLPQIDQPHFGHLGHAMPRRQLQMRVAPALGIDEAFQRRRRAGQNHRTILDSRPHHRHVAGVIDGALLLLEGLLMFFVDDDQAQFGERQE